MNTTGKSTPKEAKSSRRKSASRKATDKSAKSTKSLHLAAPSSQVNWLGPISDVQARSMQIF